MKFSIIPQPVQQVLEPIKWIIFFSCMIQVIGTIAGIIPFFAVIEIGVSLLSDQARFDVWTVVIMAIVSMFIRIFCLALSGAFTHLADLDMQLYLRRRMTKHLSQVPLGWFNEKNSGFVKKVLQEDIQIMHHLVAHSFTNLTVAIVTPIVSLLYLFFLDWQLVLLSFLPIVVGLFLYLLQYSGFEEKIGKYNQALEKVNASVVEFVRGISVIKAFGKNKQAFQQYTDSTHNFIQTFWYWMRGLLVPSVLAEVLLSPLFAFWSVIGGGILMLEYQLIGRIDLLPIIVIAPGLAAPILMIAFGRNDMMLGENAALGISQLLQVPVLPVISHPQKPTHSMVCFNHVSFSYDGHRNVVSDISFTLKPNTLTALVGVSGSGKSTLAKLLPRFWDVNKGDITIGDVSIKNIDFKTLYQQVGFVFQEVQLLNASIRENIALSKPDASMQEIVRVAQAAQIHQRIEELEEGYDTVLGEGVHLSGGESQRISIARALLADTPIIVLDEATAFADPDCEDLVQQAIANLTKHRTLLVIAHRLHTIAQADQIIVLDKGSLVEQGTHQQLIDKKGHYQALWQNRIE